MLCIAWHMPWFSWKLQIVEPNICKTKIKNPLRIEKIRGLYGVKAKQLKYLLYTDTHIHDKEGINQMKRHAAKITNSQVMTKPH